jgi:hypothetical protein
LIDFRYHVVSIIAVFLALSVGLVLGSSFLGDIAKENLDGEIQKLSRRANGLQNEVDAERAAKDQLGAFINAGKPDMVQDKLDGRSVVLVTLPGADSDITNATAKTMEESGASVSGTVSLRSAWTDPAKETALASAAGDQSGQTTYDKAAAALAAAIVHKSGASTNPGTPGTPGTPGATTAPPTGGVPSPGATPTTAPGSATTPNPGATGTHPPGTGAGDATSAETALATLNRLKNAGFIDIKGNPEKGATLAVIVAPAGPVDDPGRTNGIYLGLSRTIDGADDGTVMAGSVAATQDRGTIAALRGDDRTSKVVSSVDAANTAAGQVSVDWALVVESAEGKSGQYGPTAPDGWLPDLPVDKKNTERTS